MTLLLRDPDVKADDPAAETPVETRACPKCQAPLDDGQDWCLNCGQAQPGRLANLPGKRAAATVLALTTVLVGGAVAASYAALQDSPAPSTATSTQLAQVPAPSAAAPAPDPAAVVPPTTAAPAGTVPDATAGDGASALPDVHTPATPTPSPSAGTPSPATGSGSTSSSGTGSTGSTTGSTGTNGSGTKADTRTSTTPTVTAPVAITLADTAAALYDPFTRDTAAGDAKKALDADPGTSFPITVATGAQTIGAGLAVDLGKTQGIREIDLTTKTPGFKVEIYATDDEELPPDVLDTRWAHLKDVSDVGTGGSKQVVSLGSGTTKYRHVLLWFTSPPTDGFTVRVSELKLLG
jgi:hypothetical protein